MRKKQATVGYARSIKKRGAFASDEIAIKLKYLALRNIGNRWTRPINSRKAAINRFTIMCDDRVPFHRSIKATYTKKP